MAAPPVTTGTLYSRLAPGRPPWSLNPSGEFLGQFNAILSGANTRHYVEFSGCLSIKSMVNGSAVWRANGRSFRVHAGSYLILNDDQPYSLTIESTEKVRTFCLFFQRGLVEDVRRNAPTKSERLLDEPFLQGGESVQFLTRLEPGRDSIVARLDRLRKKMDRGSLENMEMDEDFSRIGTEMLSLHRHGRTEAARLEAARASTREELYRRLLRGRDLLLSSLHEPLRLREIAREACLSPFHFHRAFVRAFGVTPHQYFTRYRLERAAHLLAFSERSVTEICFDAGFESLGSFSSLFHRRFGVSPNAYRLAASRCPSENKKGELLARPS
jgi:AraC family transcriptional regulator